MKEIITKKPLSVELTQEQTIWMYLCKGHYKRPERVDFLKAIRMLWAIRCGYDYEESDKRMYRHVADVLFELLMILEPKKQKYIHQLVHDELTSTFKYEDLTPIEIVIMCYRNHIMQALVINRNDFELILGEKREDAVNKVLEGNGEYGDYKLIF